MTHVICLSGLTYDEQGAHGSIGAGKSTVSSVIKSMLPEGKVAVVGLADALKRAVLQMFDWDPYVLWGPSAARGTESDLFIGVDGEPLVARKILQSLGTEWGRSVCPDMWSTKLLNIMAKLRAGGYTYTAKDGLVESFGAPPPDIIVVEDIRYESEYVSLYGESISIRVKRYIKRESETINKTNRLSRLIASARSKLGMIAPSSKKHSSELGLLHIPDSAFNEVLCIGECSNEDEVRGRLVTEVSRLLKKYLPDVTLVSTSSPTVKRSSETTESSNCLSYSVNGTTFTKSSSGMLIPHAVTRPDIK